MENVITILLTAVIVLFSYKKGYKDGANRIVEEVEILNNKKKVNE